MTAAGLRRNAPDLPRVPSACGRAFAIGPVSFMISRADRVLVGWTHALWLLGLQIVMFVIYILCKGKVPVHTVSGATGEILAAGLIVFYALIMLFTAGQFGGTNEIPHPGIRCWSR